MSNRGSKEKERKEGEERMGRKGRRIEWRRKKKRGWKRSWKEKIRRGTKMEGRLREV